MTRSAPSQPETLALLREIAAAPRPTGGAAVDAARRRCAADLTALGYDVRESAFSFSEFPGRFGTPLFGATAALAVGVAGAWADTFAGSQFGPIMLLLAAALILWLGGRWLLRAGVLAVPVLRTRGVNLVATKAGASPTVWLCAHLDSKSQPIPTLVRTIGVVLEAFGFVMAVLVAAAAALGVETHPVYWTFAAAVTLVGAVPVGLSMVGERSPGALDNASGVATVLEAARLLRRAGVGVLLTDAEELGLAGARALAPALARGTVLNCDGVDDAGVMQVMFSGRRPAAVLEAARRAAREEDVPCDVGRLIPGVLTDAVAFADAGHQAVTFARGGWTTLARVHSRRDDLEHLRGTGIAEVARVMASTAALLQEHG